LVLTGRYQKKEGKAMGELERPLRKGLSQYGTVQNNSQQNGKILGQWGYMGPRVSEGIRGSSLGDKTAN